jgi:hypothetical protein
MTLLFFDALQNAATFVKPQWSAVFHQNNTGRDGSAAGSTQCQSGSNARLLTLSPGSDTLVVGVAINYNNNVRGLTVGTPILAFTSGGVVELVMMVNSTGFFEFRIGSPTGTLVATSSGHTAWPAAANGWHHHQIKVKLSNAGAGVLEMRLDGGVTTVISATGLTNSAHSGAVDGLQLGNPSTSTNGLIWFDDVYVLDTVDATSTQGRPNDTYLGDLSVKVLYPSSDGDVDQWTPSTGTAHWSLVDETTPNSTDYVSSSTTGQQDLYGLQDLPATATTVYGVQLGLVAAKSDAGAAAIKTLIKENSVATVGSTAMTLSTSYALYLGGLRTLRPSDGTPWTVTDVNGLQAGAEAA